LEPFPRRTGRRTAARRGIRSAQHAVRRAVRRSGGGLQTERGVRISGAIPGGASMIYGLNRYEIKKTRFLTGFSPFLPRKTPLFHRFSPLFNDRTFPEKLSK